mmetsp:Transcript_25714/g.40086  ORF Transcript_25714/g.40086 Transcript_25714/m.40086 type:complete len:125 (+) Transcript_25714:866-1240(+)
MSISWGLLIVLSFSSLPSMISQIFRAGRLKIPLRLSVIEFHFLLFTKGIFLQQNDDKVSLSYNEGLTKHLSDLKSVSSLIDAIQTPYSAPHLSIFYPNHSLFTPFGVFVAYFDSNMKVRYYGWK